MSRITLRIDRISLPAGAALDRAALAAALTAELSARAGGGDAPGLATARHVARIDGGMLPAGGAALAPALARATIRAVAR